MAEQTEEQKQEAAARAERERQEAATAQPPAQVVPQDAVPPVSGESPEAMKARLNSEAKISREAKEASDARVKQLEAEMAAMRSKAEEAKKEAERAEMSAVEKAQAERDDLQEQLAKERIEKNKLTVKQAAIGLASELGFRDPTLAAKLVDIAAVTSSDGQIDLGGLRTQVTDIAQKNEYLLTKPPPAPLVGPTKNPSGIDEEVLAPSSVNLRAGEDPRAALMAQKKASMDNMRDGRDPLAAKKYVDAMMAHRATNPDAIDGTMYREKSGAIPLKDE